MTVSTTSFGERAASKSMSLAPLGAILAVGLVLRLIFIGGSGFHNDIAAYQSWALTLTEHPLAQFYSSTSFADYPPGYFFVLWAIGGIYKGLVGLHLIAPSAYGVLAMLVKLPAIIMDLVDSWLLYILVRRFASERVALGAAALFALNPAAIVVSAFWGQVDSVSWGLVLAGLVSLANASTSKQRATSSIVLAWTALACSILIKPQAALVGLVFLAFAFATSDGAVRALRLRATGLGIAFAVLLAYVSAAIFHGTLNPVSAFVWLFGQYVSGSAVYPYNSINAFNLYAVKQPFWQSDMQPVVLSLFGFSLSLGPAYVLGGLLVIGATLLIVARYVQRRDTAAFFEAAMLVSFAFFLFATRMHERYVFGAFLLMIPLVAFGRRYMWATILVSATLLLNIAYSLQYQAVMEAHTPGVDATNIWPLISHPAALANVALFFVLGYLYLGGTFGTAARDIALPALMRVRTWFDPREGIAHMNRRDWLLAGLFTAVSFLVCVAWLYLPVEKVFDEIYYARAGEEYLGGKEIFEYTHPPLTKLIVTLSMILVGLGNGLSAHGDSAFGWRFLNVVIGALTVGVLYAFAKRLTSSTLFASLAALMLVCDGFHFVQSRIATPEITVAFFALTTLYAFYRLWIAAQVARKPERANSRYATVLAIVLAVGALFSAAFAYGITNLGPSNSPDFTTWSLAVAFLWFEGLVYLIARAVLPRLLSLRSTTSYADGTRVEGTGKMPVVVLPEGTQLARAGRVSAEGDELVRSAERDGTLTYTTPVAGAVFAPVGTMRVAGVTIDANDARVWLIVLAISGACLAASKWNGLFDFFVVWGLIAAVVAQRWLGRPAVFGNPFGIGLDLVVTAMFVVGGAVYTLCYVPFFHLGHNFVDMVAMQHGMYWYHSNLKATHPYASQWWQWPILQRPISYYYHDFRTGAALNNGAACCVSEIIALPNPFVWWLGLLSVPFVGVLAYIERNKGYVLLVTAYFLQWLPWIGSPRIAFEYHFYPNLAIIVLANAILLQRIWNWRAAELYGRIAVGAYAFFVVLAFAFFYPILAGHPIPWDAWQARMWFRTWI
jgi:Gpi18-like mannosyltransferase/predicted membrane-bound dolichyl-phosphate-mannose-protein mannosyltransferase